MASIPPGLAGKIEKFRPLPKPIRLQDSQNSARSRIENKLNTYRMLSVKSGLRLISFLPRLDMQSTYNPDRKTWDTCQIGRKVESLLYMLPSLYEQRVFFFRCLFRTAPPPPPSPFPSGNVETCERSMN